MEKSRLSVLFVIVRSRENRKGLCPIQCRITYLGRRKVFATGEFIRPDIWDASKQRVLGTGTQEKLVNTQLELIHNNLKRAYLTLQLKTDEFCVKDIFKEHKGESKGSKENYVLEYIEQFLEKKKKLIGKDIELGTWKKYNYAYLQVQQFIKWKYKKLDVNFSELSEFFLKEFEFFLRTELNQGPATINKCIQRFRSPIQKAVLEGICSTNPFVGYKAIQLKHQIVYLTKQELELLENHQIRQSRLVFVRDVFTFCCYTGLSYSDVFQLSHSSLEFDSENIQWIVYKRKKTHKSIRVPLLPKALAILKLYHGLNDTMLFPRISNQKANSYLKEIAAIVGIEKRLTFHVARKTFTSTILIANNVPIAIARELLGHSSIGITQKYYTRVNDEVIKTALSELLTPNKKTNKLTLQKTANT